MLFVLAGSLLSFTMTQEVVEVEPHPRGTFIYEQNYDESPASLLHRYEVEPLRALQFRNVVGETAVRLQLWGRVTDHDSAPLRGPEPQ